MSDRETSAPRTDAARLNIAVDAMGTDAAPGPEVAGALAGISAFGVDVTLLGEQSRLNAAVAAAAPPPDVAAHLSIVHCPEAITMHDAPSMAVKGKKQSSMRIGFDMVKAGTCDAIVSAGNSGAMMACGLFVLGRLPGVDRPAIITTFPTPTDQCALLDMGANVDPKPQVLAQFAVMGAVYARLQHGKPRPRVGLLANGSEEHKGTPLTRGTHALLERLAARPDAGAFSYVGYVEGRDIFKNAADVIVTDGFTGNVLLKGCEGVVGAIFEMVRSEVGRAGPLVKLGAALMKPALRRLVRRTDYAETGGAPLLGVKGLAMICHGGSDARAIKNAIGQAVAFSRSGLGDALANDIVRHEFLWSESAAS